MAESVATGVGSGSTLSSNSILTPAVPPRPKSPPDLYGRRKDMARLNMLEREKGLLEEELKFVEGLQPVSRCCKEVVEFVTANGDPFIPTNRKISKTCRLWKWLCGSSSCFNLSWICCCTGCSIHLKLKAPKCDCCCGDISDCCSCFRCSLPNCSLPKCSCWCTPNCFHCRPKNPCPKRCCSCNCSCNLWQCLPCTNCCSCECLCPKCTCPKCSCPKCSCPNCSDLCGCSGCDCCGCGCGCGCFSCIKYYCCSCPSSCTCC